MEQFAVRTMGRMTVEVKTPTSKSQQVPDQSTPSPIEQISLKFRVQVKCRHFQVAEDNSVSSLMGQHKCRTLPFEILYVPIRIFKRRDDEALQKFLSMQFETHYRDSVDVEMVADAIKDKWIENAKINGNLSMFGSVFPLTITIKLCSIVTFHERQLSAAMTESEDRMVPTTDSAIEEMVKRAKSEDIEADQSCAICLEKMEKEEKSVISKMPCLHLFHQDCIMKWLGKSHYCPICRFQMPTD